MIVWVLGWVGRSLGGVAAIDGEGDADDAVRSLLYFAAVLTVCPSVRADVRRCARRFVRGRRRPLPGMQSRSSGRHVAVTPTHYERVQCWTVVNGRRCSCAGPCLVVYGCGRWLWKVRGHVGGTGSSAWEDIQEGPLVVERERADCDPS
jgi:hypothetical protein